MSYVYIDGQMAANGSFPLADGSQIIGSPIVAANLTALQNYNVKLSTLRVGQWGYALDTGKTYQYTVIGNPPTTPHTMVEFMSGSGSSPNESNIIYFGKGGNDANDGLTFDKRVATPDQAYTLAKTSFGVLDSTNRAVIWCEDAGYYGSGVSSSLTIDAEWIDIYAPNAILAYSLNISQGNLKIKANIIGSNDLTSDSIIIGPSVGSLTLIINEIFTNSIAGHNSIEISSGASPILNININKCRSFHVTNIPGSLISPTIYASFGLCDSLTLSESSTGSIIANSINVITYNGNTTCNVFTPFSKNINDALNGSNFPSASNVFATMNDLSGTIFPESHEETSNPQSPYFYTGLQILVNSQTSLSISESPISEAAIFLFRNGQLAVPGPTSNNTHNYTRSGANITWNNSGSGGPLLTTDNITVHYNYLASGSIYEDTGDITVSLWVCTATASVPTSRIRLIRFGKFVTLYLQDWFALGNDGNDSISAPAGTIPSQFLPASGSGSATGFVCTHRSGYVPPVYNGSGSFPWSIVNISGLGFSGFTTVGVDGSIVVNMNNEGDVFNTISGQPFGFSNSIISWMIP